ncbi:putative Ovochymase-1 [Hypsibius exemplaris]|uniref:Ovochymase-1 n=1 Tax=Hypsibius exemplaris TaxID=2072580 RepID=A0A1W0WII6_HYPEX|nr:putative Ovochymase-1 [Hypsibius exemplaris]
MVRFYGVLAILLLVNGISANEQCGGIITVPPIGKAEIKSPNFPNNYPDNANCTFTITGPEGALIRFDSESFSLELPRNSVNGWIKPDYVLFTEVVNGSTVQFSDRLGGRNNVANLISTGNKVVIQFVSNANVTSTGFLITARVAPCPKGKAECPGHEAICWSADQYCDGVRDCPGGEDELCLNKNCGQRNLPSLNSTAPLTSETAGRSATSRIVGGTEAIPHSWPWMVAMNRADTNVQHCGGSIIANEWILTAAHCCHIPFDPEIPSPSFVYKVRVGAHDLKDPREIGARTINLEQIVLAPWPEGITRTETDYCLLKTAEPIMYNANTSPVCMPDATDAAPGQTCWATGWGWINITVLLDADRLRQVDLTVLSEQQCREFYPSLNLTAHVCTQGATPGKETAKGDSGSPVVCANSAGIFKQTSVISTGGGDIPPANPKLFTVLHWIAEATRNATTNYQAVQTTMALNSGSSTPGAPNSGSSTAGTPNSGSSTPGSPNSGSSTAGTPNSGCSMTAMSYHSFGLLMGYALIFRGFRSVSCGY